MTSEQEIWIELQRQESWIAWRAGRISDPVKRLRYLRATTAGDLRPRPLSWKSLILAVLTALLVAPVHNAKMEVRQRTAPAAPVPLPEFQQPEETETGDVWLVERKPDYEVYSNGLRIETAATTRHLKRSYVSVVRRTGQLRTDGIAPVGIVYHTTESHITSFEEGNNARLQRVGQWLVEYVRRHQSYHYVVDRFGRVHRVVEEESAADHAGASIWADQDRIYLGLNQSFLGVALESQTAAGDETSDSVTEAQLYATKVLTEMLRSRYRIAAGNCVTHAQVSVNAASYRIGNHTDWAANFPYAKVGLPDNYSLPLASMVFYGFGYDQGFLSATGSRMWNGLAVSEEYVRQAAGAEALTVAQYRLRQQQHYRRQMAELPAVAPGTGTLRLNRRHR
jgi:hypothetical protein